MSTTSQTIGPAVARWQDKEPLIWTISETIGEGKRAEDKKYPFDLAQLLPGFSKDFLLALKTIWIDRRLTVSLKTVHTHADRITHALLSGHLAISAAARSKGLTTPVFERIDSDFLDGLLAIQDKVPKPYLGELILLYRNQRANGAIFDPSLHLGDFPKGTPSSGDTDQVKDVGRLRKNVLASALNRATLVQILNITESAFEVGEITLDHYAFSRLLLSRVARPESFRLLRLKDLIVDTEGGTNKYFIAMTIPKAQTAKAPRVTIPLHAEVGKILEQQQEAVAKRLGDLVADKNASMSSDERASSVPFSIGDLALFPTGLRRMSQIAKGRMGMHATASELTRTYVDPLKALTGARISHTALRHTMGTQLAIAGCSAATISAVLLHASKRSASVYVDLFFDGAIDEISNSLEPAFLAHFPVFKAFVSNKDVVDPAKRVVSTSVDSARHVTTGECGRDRACQFAPIVCYGCHRFKPCFDVDHSINLEVVVEEIESARHGGLARQVDLKTFTQIANRIRVVISVCEMKRDAVEYERRNTSAAS
jgi:hypothetical protein